MGLFTFPVLLRRFLSVAYDKTLFPSVSHNASFPDKNAVCKKKKKKQQQKLSNSNRIRHACLRVIQDSKCVAKGGRGATDALLPQPNKFTNARARQKLERWRHQMVRRDMCTYRQTCLG